MLLRRCVLGELGESHPRPFRGDKIPLALVALMRLLERGGCVGGLAGEQEHLSEVGVRVALRVEQVGVLAERNRFVSEPFRLGVLATARTTLALGCRQSISLETSSLVPAQLQGGGPAQASASSSRSSA